VNVILAIPSELFIGLFGPKLLSLFSSMPVKNCLVYISEQIEHKTFQELSMLTWAKTKGINSYRNHLDMLWLFLRQCIFKLCHSVAFFIPKYGWHEYI